jgi:hypothetical protein
MAYRAPTGYRHHFAYRWLVPGRSLLIGLLLVAGILVYLRGDRLMPLLRGTTVTRVQPPGPITPPDPYATEPQWSTQRKSAELVPYPTGLSPTSAGTASAGVAGYKCVGADGTVVYRQQRDCGESGVVPVPVTGSRLH